MSKVCQKCSTVLNDDARFCIRCGTRVDVQDEVKENVQQVVETAEPEKVAEETVVEAVAAEPVAEEPVVEEPAVEAPVVEEAIAEEPVAETVAAEVEIPQQDVPEEASPAVEAEPEAETAESFTEEAPKADTEVFAEFKQEEVPVPQPVPQAEPVNEKAKTSKKSKKTKKVREPKSGKKVAAKGVVGAVLLSLFLVINLVLIVVCGGAAGLFALDVDTLKEEVSLDGKTSVSEMIGGADILGKEEVNAFTKLVESGSVKIQSEGKEYLFEIPEETRGTLTNAVGTLDKIEETVDITIANAKNVLGVVICAVAGYLLIVTIVLVFAICWCLGNTRKSLLLPGITMIVVGLGFLGTILAAAFYPAGFGAIAGILLGIKAIFAYSICTAMVLAVLGMVLTMFGATGKTEKA